MSFRLVFWISIIIGLILRLWFPYDMEWKFDENWMFTNAMSTIESGHIPLIGMVSSANIANPGLSLWIFILIGLVASTPIAMFYGVVILNIAALFGMIFFTAKKITSEVEKKIWYMGLALWAISPLPILFSRKIWAQDVLPFFCMLIVWFHSLRSKWWGALCWGIFGALIGQIHISGFFYAFAFFIYTAIRDFRFTKTCQWGFWFLGSFIGAVPLLPWLNHLWQHPTPSSYSIHHLLSFSFYTHWILNALGTHLFYILNSGFIKLMAWPIFFGVPTYLVALAHLVLLAFLIKQIFELFKNRKKEKFSLIHFLFPESQTLQYFIILLLFFSIPLSLIGARIHPHYLIICFPFIQISLAWIFQNKPKTFITILVLQALISLNFALYIHTNKGAPHLPYGESYGEQLKKDEKNL